MPNDSPVPPSAPRPAPRWRRLLLWALAGLLALLLLLGVAAAFIYPSLPSLDKLTDYQPKQPLRIYTSDGVLIGEFGAERRTYLPLKDIPKRMQDALLAVEDSAFYEHGGISYTGIVRAVASNAVSSRKQGASTITQQLARDLYLTKRQLYSRKFIEMLLALKIESQLTKEKILEVYMNQIYLGQKAYGFEAAAQTYFGKSLKDLDVAETAMLAGLPQNPAYANPVANFQRAKRRQLLVLERLKDTGVITPEECDRARDEKLHIRSSQDERLHGEYVAELVRQQLFAQYGEDAYTLGLKVYTTLVADQQQAAYRGLRKTLLEYERRRPWRGPEGFVELPDDAAEEDAAIAQALAEHPDNDELRAAVVTKVAGGKLVAALQSGDEVVISGDGLRALGNALSDKARHELQVRRGSILRVLRGAPTKEAPQGAWAVTQSPEAEGALVAVAPDSGEVRALVGGFDFNRNKFNHATQAFRQPGSSFKPLVYSAALELGMTPNTLINDAPLVYDHWEPHNYDGSYDGPMPMRTALAKSKNMVTIRLLEQVSPARARQWAGRFGLDVERQPDNLTLALGSGAVTPMQMAGAYSVFANGGQLRKPVIVQRVLDAKGQVLFQAATVEDGEPAISARNAFVVSSLLQEVTTRGTAARAAAQLRRTDLYGKTGTTNDSVDAWFAGFHPKVAAVVWIGYDNPRSLGDRESGGGLALPAWISFMEVALRGVPPSDLQPPSEGLVREGSEWVFEEFAGPAGIQQVGLSAEALASAASAPASAPASSPP
ncbi:PBP1A family penicillin-binding protein [Pelomonas sp. APW6]|uniref:Penicillin-binding protein 1A n=1 Tax=Roseateles subflavus TaxID=3053353 RepID=A0ABT7LJU9_9BURK|nr:PBP1A family penicillin-binding protein [Pelomonas sp. APW6]MDL5033137.1 PBP1A family penicillin-binding protein [Pelomonas sp. APW6]